MNGQHKIDQNNGGAVMMCVRVSVLLIFFFFVSHFVSFNTTHNTWCIWDRDVQMLSLIIQLSQSKKSIVKCNDHMIAKVRMTCQIVQGSVNIYKHLVSLLMNSAIRSCEIRYRSLHIISILCNNNIQKIQKDYESIIVTKFNQFSSWTLFDCR